MAFKNNFPESAHIPIVQVPISSNTPITESILDPLSADYTFMLNSQTQLPYKNFKITAATQSRLDLVDYANNGKVELWWLIGYVNGIVNPLYDINVDNLIQIPNSSSLTGSLQTSTTTSLSSVDIP